MSEQINNTILIEDKSSGINAVVLPEYGGMIYQLGINGKDILYNDAELLGKDSLFCGGMPVLFPFCSRMVNDTYKILDKSYRIPMHGFAKDMAFEVKDQSGGKTALLLKSDDFTRSQYPFDFELELTYAIVKNTISSSAKIRNLSPADMPYYIGWHPFFINSDRKRSSLEMQADNYLDFIKNERGVMDKPVDLTEKLDHVYYPVKGCGWRLVNEADGYEVRVRGDELHDVITIATEVDGCACVEPWTGVPNGMNSGDRVRLVKAGDSVITGFEMDIGLIL